MLALYATYEYHQEFSRRSSYPVLVCVSMAEDRPGRVTEKSAEVYDLAVRPIAKATGSADR